MLLLLISAYIYQIKYIYLQLIKDNFTSIASDRLQEFSSDQTVLLNSVWQQIERRRSNHDDARDCSAMSTFPNERFYLIHGEPGTG